MTAIATTLHYRPLEQALPWQPYPIIAHLTPHFVCLWSSDPSSRLAFITIIITSARLPQCAFPYQLDCLMTSFSIFIDLHIGRIPFCASTAKASGVLPWQHSNIYACISLMTIAPLYDDPSIRIVHTNEFTPHITTCHHLSK